MQDINPDLGAVADISESPYYKRLQKELREKKIKQPASKTLQTTHGHKKNDTTAPPSSQHPSQTAPHTFLNTDYFKDRVLLSQDELTNTLSPPSQQEDLTADELQQPKDDLTDHTYNALEISKRLSYKIDFGSKKEELKEMYRFNIQESASDNVFTGRFARFKLGVIGQILTLSGVSISELNQLKQASLTQLFDRNIADMQDNIQNSELLAILKGTTKKTRRRFAVFNKIQATLIKQMNNMGRVGFWSKSRLLEEKITQCQKIKQDFTNEKQHLQYLLAYADQNRTPS